MAHYNSSLLEAKNYLRSRGIWGFHGFASDGQQADPDVVAPLEGGEESSSWNMGLRRKFLRRLALSLVTYGGSAPRTEYLIEQAAERLHVETNIAVFSSIIFLLFPDKSNPTIHETHMLRVESEVDVNKLQRVDELANSVGLPHAPLMMAQWQLQSLVMSPSLFGGWYWQLLSYALSAPTAALLFFSGNYWDAGLSFILGLGVGILSLLPPISPVFGDLLEFIAALFASFLARVFTYHLQQLDVCFFAMATSGLVWLLPGQDLTIGVSEVMEKAVFTGTARIVKALVSSLQLGFGLAIGENLAWWIPHVEPKACTGLDMSLWVTVIWFLGFAISVNIFLRARLDQWTGMILITGIGYAVNEWADARFGSETATVLAAFAIGLTGMLYSFLSRDIPLTLILAGIQALLPGGIGVQGIQAFVKDDAVSGIAFVMNMVIICLSITIGLLLSKVVLHDGVLGATKVLQFNRHTLKHEFGDVKPDAVAQNEEDEDEHVAI